MPISARRPVHTLATAVAITSGLALLAPVATAAPARAEAPAPSYTARAVEPGGAPGEGSTAVAVNNRGQIAGNILSGTAPTRGFSGTAGSVRWLPGGATSVARDIADDGTVVGSSADGAQESWLQVPTRWVPKATAPQQLPMAWPADNAFWRSGVATAVSANGRITGTAATGYRSGNAMTWDQRGRGGTLLAFNGDGWALNTTDIANNGVAVGYDQVQGPLSAGATTQRAVIISNARVQALPTSARESQALAISPQGRYIVGTADGVAVLFRVGANALPLPGARDFVPAAVTDAGTGVGNSRGADGLPGTADDVPMLYTSGRAIALAPTTRMPAGWRLVQVRDINARGQIAGTAVDASGRRHAVLLTPGR
ncbi:hypothetical protein [Gephyromycinifex aptenodytis]|uniref:hypothetical protein n=1 Tax=Gephyromycinifex aptenodytis TaxID=2716227 RepID=UPI0014481708|nr:hypothetical protein [Gephyromycinifex aptenodytis]